MWDIGHAGVAGRDQGWSWCLPGCEPGCQPGL